MEQERKWELDWTQREGGNALLDDPEGFRGSLTSENTCVDASTAGLVGREESWDLEEKGLLLAGWTAGFDVLEDIAGGPLLTLVVDLHAADHLDEEEASKSDQQEWTESGHVFLSLGEKIYTMSAITSWLIVEFVVLEQVWESCNKCSTSSEHYLNNTSLIKL